MFKEEWQYKAKNWIATCPVLTDDRVYVESKQDIISISTDNGGLDWVYRSKAPVTQPVIHGDHVYTNSHGNGLHAMNRDTGRPLWQHRDTYGNQYRPVADTDQVVTVLNDQEIASFNAETGSKNWTWKREVTPVNAWSLLNLENKDVYLGTGKTGFHCINTENAELKWRYTANTDTYIESYVRPGVKRNNSIYTCNEKPEITCLNSETGELRWKHRLNHGETQGVKVTTTDNSVIAGSLKGKLYCLDPSSGQEKFSVEMENPVGTPTTTQNYIFISTGVIQSNGKQRDGELLCLDKDNGEILYRYNKFTSIPFDPVIKNGDLYVGTNQGTLHKIRLESVDGSSTDTLKTQNVYGAIN